MAMSRFNWTGLRLLAAAGAVICALGAAPASGVAQAGRSILEYDDQGRVIGVTEEEGGDVDTERQQPGFDDPAEDPSAYEPGEILAINPPDSILPRLQSMGFSLIEKLDLRDLDIAVWRIRTPDRVKTTEALDQFRRAFPRVITDLNALYTLSAAPDGNTVSRLPYDRETVGWGAVGPTCGTGLRLGIIDSPVDIDHSSFAGRKIIHRSFVTPERTAAPGEHGTAIAAMLVGAPSGGTAGGLIPGASLFAASIFEDRGGRVIGNLSAMLRSIDWLARHRIQVLNLSIAGSKNTVLVAAIDRALAKGMVLVAAAGNNGPDAKPAWPAAHPGVIAVTAVDKDLSHYRFANQGRYIDFSAPGVRIVTSTPRGLKEQSGTSFAAPYITSMVAVHLAAGYSSDPEVLRQSLRRYSVDLGTKGKDQIFGWGLVRLRPDC